MVRLSGLEWFTWPGAYYWQVAIAAGNSAAHEPLV